MYEKIAWEHFIKTGNIEMFLEYKKICDMKNEHNLLNQNVGEKINEFTQSQGDSYKGDTI